jgi:FAD/FMN-containing dehydrogenase
MKKVRCSYGTFGIVYEVTYKIRPLLPLAVYHETFGLQEFIARQPELKARNESMMYYIFPFVDKITVEFRRYNPSATGEPDHCAWGLRNHFWGSAGPKFGHDVEKNIPTPSIRYGIIDAFGATWRFQLENLVKGDYTIPGDQIIHYPAQSDDSRYTFSLFAFPEEEYPATITQFFQFAKDYYRQKGYRSNLLYVGYWIKQDQQALLSYSYNGNVMTIDPVSTANPGWDEFLEAYNQFCSERNGVPLLNQTYGLTPTIVQKAFGDRLTAMKETRKTYDPDGRLLNDYFRSLLS